MQSTLPLNDFTQQGNERCDYGLTHWRTCTLSCIIKTSFVCGAGRPHKTLGHNRCSCNVFLFFNLYCSSWCPCDSWMTRQPGTVVPEVTAIQNWRDGLMLKKEKLARKMHKCKTKTKCFFVHVDHSEITIGLRGCCASQCVPHHLAPCRDFTHCSSRFKIAHCFSDRVRDKSMFKLPGRPQGEGREEACEGTTL